MIPIHNLKNFISKPAEKVLPRSWIFFGSLVLLITGNIILSYFPIPLLLTLWILLLGIVAPLFILYLTLIPKKSNPKLFFQEESIPAIPLWLWWALGGLAVVLHLVKLTTLFQWPFKDEGIFGYFAIRLCEQWNGALLQGLNQLPTLFTWIQSLFFRFLGPSLFSLWSYPAFWSLLTLPATWFASRKYFSRSRSVLILGVMAFSFWPLLIGRFSTQAVFMVFWEWMEFLALGAFLNARREEKEIRLLLLAIATGVGFYTYLSWPAVACLAVLTLLANSSEPIRNRIIFLITFSSVCALIAFPLALSYKGQGSDYFHHLWSMGSNHHWAERFQIFTGYFTDLFWGARHGAFRYGPLWGGFMNPLCGAFFLLGLIAAIKKAKSLAFLFTAAFAALFLPAVLSNDFEEMRMVQWIPVLAIGTALGIDFFLQSFSARKRVATLLMIFLVSLTLDLIHLFVIYPGHWEKNLPYYSDHKSVEFYRAYSYLKPIADREGSGLILLNFNPDPYDQTLFVATYGFNAAENPGLAPASAKWVAVLTNIHERPYLEKFFPEGRCFPLSDGLNRRDGGFLLGVIPVIPTNQKILTKWRLADQSLGGLTHLVMERGVDPDQRPMLDVLEKAYPQFEGDPLLESRFWRVKALHHLAGGKIEDAIMDEENAIKRGLPLAHLYNEIGCFLFLQKRDNEALAAFHAATLQKENYTDALVNLSNLNLIMRK